MSEWLSATATVPNGVMLIFLHVDRLVRWISFRKGPSMAMDRIYRTTVIDVFSPGKETSAVRVIQLPRR